MNYVEEMAERIRAQIPADALPDEDVTELMLAYAVLAETVGEAVTNREVHDAWVAWMTQIDPGHESLVPYDQLDPATQQEDSVFTRAIKAAIRSGS